MYLGIELGSTRIKAMVLDETHHIIITQSYLWQSHQEAGYWTYKLDEAWQGIRDVIRQIGQQIDLSLIKAIGISAMMHGFLPLDKNNRLLTNFRTWKNVNTEVAAQHLSNLFQFNIPLRWSIAHYYQAWLDKEPYVKEISHFTTLAGYIHYLLSDQKVLGIGDASGMFPIDVNKNDYDQVMINKFKNDTNVDVRSMLPKIVSVDQPGGYLTEKGRKLLDPSLRLKAGILLAPPEGDAQTGMIATNAIEKRTGNVSAGTSVFAMVVLETPLKKHYPQIDIVQTPLGAAVAMVHANECTSLIDPWVMMFGEAAQLMGAKFDNNQLFETMYEIALDQKSYLGKFMKSKLIEAISDLQKGIEILINEEHVKIDYLQGHGGYFKSKNAGATIMSETLNITIKLLKTAAEGGSWGIAVLAGYCYSKQQDDINLINYLKEIFKGE